MLLKNFTPLKSQPIFCYFMMVNHHRLEFKPLTAYKVRNYHWCLHPWLTIDTKTEIGYHVFFDLMAKKSCHVDSENWCYCVEPEVSTIKELYVDSANNIPLIMTTINNNYSLVLISTIFAICNAHVAYLKKAYLFQCTCMFSLRKPEVAT